MNIPLLPLDSSFQFLFGSTAKEKQTHSRDPFLEMYVSDQLSNSFLLPNPQ